MRLVTAYAGGALLNRPASRRKGRTYLPSPAIKKQQIDTMKSMASLTVSALPRFAFFIFIRVCFLQPRLYLEWPQGDLRNSTHVLV